MLNAADPYPTSSILAVCAITTAVVTTTSALAVTPALTAVLLAGLPVVFAPLVLGLWGGRVDRAAFGNGALVVLAAVATTGPASAPTVVAVAAGAWITAGLTHLSLITRVERGTPAIADTAARWFSGLTLAGVLIASAVVGLSPSLPERTVVSDAAAAFALLAVLVIAAGRHGSPRQTDP